MFKYFNLFIVLLWIWLTWVMLPSEREQPQDIEDGHEQPVQSNDAVQDFMKKLKEARETNETVYKRQHYNELPWYERFGIWLESEFDEYLEFLLYSFASDHSKQAEKGYPPEKSFSWESFKRGMVTGEYLVIIQFINALLIVIFHRWILDRISKIRAFRGGETEESPDRPAASGRTRRAVRPACVFGRVAKRPRAGRKHAMIV